MKAMLFLFALALPLLSEDRALLIGVGTYKHHRTSPIDARLNLPGIAQDLDRMRIVAEDFGFSTGQLRVLANEQATLPAIRAGLAWLNEAGPSDRILIYFSGHGGQTKDLNGDEDDGLDEFLTPYEYPEAMVLDDEIGAFLRKVRGQAFVFIDACHSGSASKSISGAFDAKGVTDTDASRTMEEERFVVLSATRDSEVTVPSDDGSAFTKGISDATKRAAATGRGIAIVDLERQLNRVDPVSRRPPSTSVVLGSDDLAKRNLRRPVRASSNSQLWEKLEKMTDQATQKLSMTLNKTEFRVGDELLIRVSSQAAGFLYVFAYGKGNPRATILFPNRCQPNNEVRSDQTVEVAPVSSRCRLTASLNTSGSPDTLLISILLREPLQASFSAERILAATQAFLSLDDRDFEVQVRPFVAGGYAAAKAATRILPPMSPSYNEALNKGLEFLKSDRCEAAEQHFRDANNLARSNETRAVALYRIGDSLACQKNYFSASEYYRAAIRIEPDRERRAIYRKWMAKADSELLEGRGLAPADLAGALSNKDFGEKPRISIFIEFKEGLAIPTDRGFRLVDVLAESLRSFPGSEVLLVGHTDVRGTPEMNMALSLKRAEKLKDILASKYHMDSTKLSVEGRGELEPLYPGEHSDAAIHQLNRRVEVVLQ